MRTTRSLLYGGVSLKETPWTENPPDRGPLPDRDLPFDRDPSGQRPSSACWDRDPPPCEQNHRRLWKYNLAATSLRAVKICFSFFWQRWTVWDFENLNPRRSVCIFRTNYHDREQSVICYSLQVFISALLNKPQEFLFAVGWKALGNKFVGAT